MRVDLDFTITDRLGAFVQVQDVRFFGETMTTIGRTSPGLDLHQAYLRVNDFSLSPESGATRGSVARNSPTERNA